MSPSISSARLSTIVSACPAPSGWVACYLGDETESLITLPIAMWVLVEYLEGDLLGVQELRHFVAIPDGGIVDFEDIDRQFLCVIEPGRDAKSTVIGSVIESFRTKKDVLLS